MTNYTEPKYESAALVTIDVQSDTLDGQPLEIAGTSAALPNMVRLAHTFRAQKRPIFHVVRIYRPDGSNVDLCRRSAVEQGAEILIAGSPGCEIAADLRPNSNAHLDPELLLSGELQHWGEQEFVVYKPRWGAFFGTHLLEWLQVQGVTTVVFAGCNFPNCPRTSIYQASERDLRVVVASDALSGIDAAGVRQLEAIGVHVLPVETIVEGVLGAQTPLPA
jgi:nicotinamidase-related amidase